MWWPAVAHTNSPPISAITSAIAFAFSRRSASPVSRVDDVAHGALVDARLALVGREHDRRLVERLALHHEIAAGELLGHSAHVHAREDHLGAGRADVDADRDQREVVLQPQRVGLGVEGAEIVVVVVMFVVRIVAVHVQPVRALQVVLQRVGLFLLQGLGHRNQILKLSIVSGANSSSGLRSVFDSPCSW
jgi:hypothetical protein